jgi:hypothetical protein
MKKLLIAFAALMVSVAAYGQGEVNFNNRITGVVDARVLMPDGTTGAGAGITAQLYGGPAGSVESALVPLTPTTDFRTSSAAAQGYVNAAVVQVPGIASGGTAAIQMRAYQGASYDAASLKGKSNIIPVSLGGGTLPPGNLSGLNGFTLVPEPSTIALAVMGAGLLLFRRRK